MQRSLAKSLKAPTHRGKLDVWVLKLARSDHYVWIESGSSELNWVSDPAEASWFETKERARRTSLQIRQPCFPVRFAVTARAYSISRARDYLSSPSLLTNNLEMTIGNLGYRLSNMQEEKYRLSSEALMSQIWLNGLACLPNDESPLVEMDRQGARYECSMLQQGIEKIEDGVAVWVVRCASLIVKHLAEVDGKVSPGTLINFKKLVGYPTLSSWIYRRMFSLYSDHGSFNRLSAEIASRTGLSIAESKLQEWVIFASVTLLEDELGSDSFDKYLAGIPCTFVVGNRLLPIGTHSILKSLDDRTHQPKLRSMYVPDR
jgi:hypothetical protein